MMPESINQFPYSKPADTTENLPAETPGPKELQGLDVSGEEQEIKVTYLPIENVIKMSPVEYAGYALEKLKSIPSNYDALYEFKDITGTYDNQSFNAENIDIETIFNDMRQGNGLTLPYSFTEASEIEELKPGSNRYAAAVGWNSLSINFTQSPTSEGGSKVRGAISAHSLSPEAESLGLEDGTVQYELIMTKERLLVIRDFAQYLTGKGTGFSFRVIFNRYSEDDPEQDMSIEFNPGKGIQL